MKLKQIGENLYDIICCQTHHYEERLSIDTRDNKFDISDEYTFGDMWYDIKGPLKCPVCKKKVPDHIMLQLKLLAE